MEAVLALDDDSGPPASVYSRIARELVTQLDGGAVQAVGLHDDALTLLAADAFMTFACEATAESAPGDLAGLR